MRVILFISIEKLSEGRLVRLLCCKTLTIPRDIHVLYFLIQRGFPEYKTHSSYSFPVNESPLAYDNDLRIDRKTHSFHRLSTKYSSFLVINSLRPKRHRQPTNIALTRTKFLMQYKMRLRCRSLTWQLFPYWRIIFFQEKKEWNNKIQSAKTRYSSYQLTTNMGLKCKWRYLKRVIGQNIPAKNEGFSPRSREKIFCMKGPFSSF